MSIIDALLGNLGDKVAHLKAIEHTLHTARDDADYADLRKLCEERIGCDAARLKAVLGIIADAAHELCP